jgi:UDP:flavonoid glycosyltransferase YjiC (YdhE family)
MPDWPASVRATGFSVWEGPAGAELPDGLAAHLDAGDPPVLVTLGTAALTNSEALLAALARQIDALGARAVFLVGDAAREHPVLRDRDDAWAFAPLPPVLARCRAVVHAGGLGTTAAVLTAGRPSVVLPQIFDQRWHAERVRLLGAGLDVPDWARRPGSVAAALERVLTEPSFTEAAAALAADLATEDGPRAAADAVEARLADPAPA